MSFSSEVLGKEEAKLIRSDFEMSCRFFKSYKCASFLSRNNVQDAITILWCYNHRHEQWPFGEVKLTELIAYSHQTPI